MSSVHVLYDTDLVDSILDSLSSRLRDLPEPYREQIAPGLEQLADCLKCREPGEQAGGGEARPAQQENETKFQMLVESMPQLVWMARPDGTTDYLNQRAAEFDGFYQLADDTWTWQPVAHPDEQEGTISAWQRAIETGEPYEVEHRARMADGSYRWYLTRGIPVKDEQGQVLHWYGTSTDIHQLKEAELSLRASQARLRESEERFRTSVENLEDAFAILAAVREPGAKGEPGKIVDLRFEYINEVGCRMKQRSFEELVGHSPREIQPSFYTPELIRRSIQVIETGDPFIQEDVEYEEDEQRLRQAFQLRVFKMGDGVVVMRQDITRQKGVELELRKRQAELRMREAKERARSAELNAIMEAAPAIIWVTHDPDSREISGNRAAYEFLRASPGANLSTSAPEEQRPRNFKIYQNGRQLRPEEMGIQISAATGRALRDYEVEIVFEDGARANLLGNITPLLDEESRPAGAVGAFLDITARVTAENAFREIQRRFTVALSAVPISVYTIDRDLRYTWMYNPRHGYSVQQLLGKRDDEVLPLEDAAVLIAAKQQVIDTGQGIQREVKFPFDGQTAYYILTLEPIFDVAGRVVGMIGAGLDITQQRLMEVQHQETVSQVELQRRLNEHREKERQQIARDIHDGPIQNMVSILFNLQADKETIRDSNAQEVLDSIADELRRSVQELREVVNELRPPALLRYGLSRAIRIHCQDFHEKYPEIRIELDLTEDANLLPEETCLVLYRIYQEAINNIIRHAEASQVWVRYQPDGQNLVLEIKDNGKGFEVPADFVNLARQNHFGMAGMRERVEAVGGKFRIISRPGQGTRVEIKVPVVAQ
jgi:PAS domain S-box-containing protein